MWQALLPLANGLIDKFFPNKDEAAKRKVELLEMHQKGELAHLDSQVKIAMGQIAINKEDAKSRSKFQSWWRPGAAWVCVFGLAYPIFTALLQWGLELVAFFGGVDLAGFPAPPEIDTAALISLLMGLLGLGGMRGVEKHKRLKLTSGGEDRG